MANILGLNVNPRITVMNLNLAKLHCQSLQLALKNMSLVKRWVKDKMDRNLARPSKGCPEDIQKREKKRKRSVAHLQVWKKHRWRAVNEGSTSSS